jgi:Fe-S cluster assembly protein SufD
VGQLDEEAMFYMRQRGICERTSRMLLMFSFVGEVIDMIDIPALKERVSDLTSRRLKGELSACETVHYPAKILIRW